jgi:hypothetical protein
VGFPEPEGETLSHFQRARRLPGPLSLWESPRKPQGGPSAYENANRAATGPLVDLYNEGRRNKGH